VGKNVDKIKEAYREKAETAFTLSNIPVKSVYKPDDIEDTDYKRDIADPGEYPFTRGIFTDMFRGRYWTRREVCGFGTPGQTNQRLLQQIEEGVGGLNVIVDMPTRFGIDVLSGVVAFNADFGGHINPDIIHISNFDNGRKRTLILKIG